MNYTEKILNHANKINELHNIASEAVRKGVLSSFTVNDRDHSDMIGKGLYLGLNMTYHAIELEINNIKSMMENGDKEMKEFELKVGDKVFIREDLENGEWYGSDTWTNSMVSGAHTVKLLINSGRRFSLSEYDADNPSVVFYYTPEMIDWDKTKELQSKESEVEELTVEIIKELLDEKLSGFNTENIRNQSTAKEIITIENTVMKKGITEVNKLHDLFHIKFNVDGVYCIVLRTTAGHLCGYIKTESEFEGDDYQGADEVFNVIGGITFVQSGFVGFDCAHYDQMIPLREYSTDGRYLPLTEVIGMTIDLASQENKLRGGEKKEPSATFDQLIDVAVKASKENIVIINHLEFDNILITEVSGISGEIEVYNSSTQGEISSAIDWIKSLYIETFTIDDFQDTRRLASGDKALLANGEEVIFSNRTGVDDSLWFEYSGFQSAIIPYIALKGATITQNKGGK